MTARTARAWIVLAAVAALVLATVAGSELALLAAGLFCCACALLVVRLDSQRKRGGTRR